MHRLRLLAGFAAAVSQRGYATTTIAHMRDPALTRSCLLEIQAAGPRALELRLRGRAKFAGVLRAFVERTRVEHPRLRPLSAAMATAVVGGVDELLLVNVEAGARSRLTELRGTASELIRAVLGVQPR